MMKCTEIKYIRDEIKQNQNKTVPISENLKKIEIYIPVKKKEYLPPNQFFLDFMGSCHEKK